jgi:hypothetical protein
MERKTVSILKKVRPSFLEEANLTGLTAGLSPVFIFVRIGGLISIFTIIERM